MPEPHHEPDQDQDVDNRFTASAGFSGGPWGLDSPPPAQFRGTGQRAGPPGTEQTGHHARNAQDWPLLSPDDPLSGDCGPAAEADSRSRPPTMPEPANHPDSDSQEHQPRSLPSDKDQHAPQAGCSRVTHPPMAPVPVRQWAIGDPGRAFTEVDAELGNPLDAPDTVFDAGWVGDLAVRAASVRGLSHRQKGTPRQDAYGIARSSDNEWIVVVVADGVSSGPVSHRAAQLVARYAARTVAGLVTGRALLSRSDFHDVFSRSSQRILHLGERELGKTPTEAAKVMATTATILVCAVRPLRRRRTVSIAWLGDSPVWMLERDDCWTCLTEVKGAGQEVASSAVAALPYLPEDPNRLPTCELDVPSDAVLLVMTDGVGDPLGDGTGPVGSALAKAWREPPSSLDFALQVGFGRKGYDDDRTVVGLWSANGAGP
jgi:serine/threonine protein phosphatase PrpC